MSDIAVGIILAFTAAVIYGFLGLSFELAAKRDYPNIERTSTAYRRLFCTYWVWNI